MSRSQIDTLTTAIRDADKTRLELNQSLTVQVDELTSQVIRLEDDNRELEYQLKDSKFTHALSSSPCQSAVDLHAIASDKIMTESDKQWFEHMILSDSLSETNHLKQLQHELVNATATTKDSGKDEIKKGADSGRLVGRRSAGEQRRGDRRQKPSP